MSFAKSGSGITPKPISSATTVATTPTASVSRPWWRRRTIRYSPRAMPPAIQATCMPLHRLGRGVGAAHGLRRDRARMALPQHVRGGPRVLDPLRAGEDAEDRRTAAGDHRTHGAGGPHVGERVPDRGAERAGRRLEVVVEEPLGEQRGFARRAGHLPAQAVELVAVASEAEAV